MQTRGPRSAEVSVNRWDISVALLKTYLSGHDLVFLFDNNQQGNANGQDLLIWGQARIVDANGNTINDLCFEISTGSGGCLDAGADPQPLLADFLPAVGDFCVDKVSGVGYNYGIPGNDGDCAGTSVDHPEGGYYVSNNISTSSAEFAVFNQELNDAVLNPNFGNYFLSVNIKYAGNDAGAEQLWICSECDRSNNVPEPASVALFVAALLSFVVVREGKSRISDVECLVLCTHPLLRLGAC